MSNEWSFIRKNLAIGGLLSYRVNVLEHFDFALNCAWELCPEESTPGEICVDEIGVHHIRLDDCDDMSSQVESVNKASSLLLSKLRNQDRCLVTCAMGRNRSSLVVAEALKQEGFSVDAIIERIRSKRGKYALSNKAFVTYLRRS